LLKPKEEEARKIFEFENIKFENDEEQKNIEELLIRIEDQEDVQAYKIASKEMLDEYEKVNNEQKFFNNEDNVNIEEDAKKEIIDFLQPVPERRRVWFRTGRRIQHCTK